MLAYCRGLEFLGILSVPAINRVCRSCGGLSPVERILWDCSVLPPTVLYFFYCVFARVNYRFIGTVF
jgi:hypothetical protein